MKKFLVLFLFIFSFSSFLFAADLEIQGTKNVDYNNGLIEIPDVTIKFDTLVTGFDLVWQENEEIIWDSNIEDISGITGDISFSTGHKRINFQGTYSGDITIKGLKSRIYKDNFKSSLGLDYTGDNEIDNYSSDFIRYDDSRTSREYDDETPPLPPKNINYEISENNVYVNWINSPDLDIQYHVIKLYRNGSLYKSFRVSNGDYTIKDLDFENYDWSIQVLAKDKYFLSDGQKIVLEKETQDSQTSTGDESMNGDAQTGTGGQGSKFTGNNQVCIQVIQHAKNPETGECKAFSTPCDVPDGWKKVPYCEGKIDIFTGFTQRKTYNFENQFFNIFQTKFDRKIKILIKDSKTSKKQNIIKTRTNILQLLKDYENEKINQKEVKDKLQDLVIDFKLLIENKKGEK